MVDCANGAASVVAPEGLAGLGATVTTLHDDPDGININDKCGSTDPGDLARTVLEVGADVGLALDGDADRVIAVDHQGAIIDGDVLLALFALDLARRGQLAGNTVVVTVMTNLGFRLAMESHGIGVRETDVGDRHVLAALDADGLALGGEQSGHIIFRTRSTTGDGILTGLCLADLMKRSGQPLAQLADGLVERVPQVLVNVPIPQPERLAESTEIWEAVAKAEAELGHEGRVLLRPSGTEPLVRVMVEARVEAQANAVAAQLVGLVEAALGLVAWGRAGPAVGLVPDYPLLCGGRPEQCAGPVQRQVVAVLPGARPEGESFRGVVQLEFLLPRHLVVLRPGDGLQRLDVVEAVVGRIAGRSDQRVVPLGAPLRRGGGRWLGGGGTGEVGRVRGAASPALPGPALRALAMPISGVSTRFEPTCG